MAIFVKTVKSKDITTIPTKLVASLSAPALAIVVYICASKSDRLDIDDILSRFGIGRHTWLKVSKELREKDILQVSNTGGGSNLIITI